MPSYLGTPGLQHDAPERLGVLIVNLGTPDAPTATAVRRFLAEFLWDPRVIETSRPLWWLILHGIILRVRPRRSAHAYAQIWTPKGSPLLCQSRELVDAVAARLGSLLHGDVPVVLGMTYGNPSIATALGALHEAAVRRLLVLPLYPQYSGSSTGAVFDRVTAGLQQWRWLPELRFIGQYYDEPTYIEALADSVVEHWRSHGRKHLLFSFHSLPQRYVLAGDPYHGQCLETAQLVAARLGLAADDWSVGFQSRVGREVWLKPYTDELLRGYARSSRKRITVVCPGFATDCLETLEEIVLRNRADFLTHGGEAFDYVPALNAGGQHVEVLSRLLLRHAQGWPDAELRTAASMGDKQARHM